MSDIIQPIGYISGLPVLASVQIVGTEMLEVVHDGVNYRIPLSELINRLPEGPKGEKGDKGDQGEQGPAGLDGADAFEMWKIATGQESATLEDFVEAIKGLDAFATWRKETNQPEATFEEYMEAIKGEKGDQGVEGKNAFEVWKEMENLPDATFEDFQASISGKNAFETWKVETNQPDATFEDFMAAIKGEKGDIGPRGSDGYGFSIIAALDDIEQLYSIEDSEEDDAYLIQGNLYVWREQTWQNLGSIQGPAGLNAYEMAVQEGFEGTLEEWRETLRGEDGMGLRILGSFRSEDALPKFDNYPGDCYIINYTMWVWDGQRWEPVGQVGPEGRSAFQLAKDSGSIPANMTLSQWLQSLNGKDAYQVAVETGFQGSRADWVASLKGVKGDKGDKGDQGDVGPMGPAINVKGKVTTEGELPTEGELGDAYFIGTDLWAWTGSAYENMGSIKGEKGDVGPEGPQGPMGPEGKDAYQVAVDEGFEGTRAEWLESMRGPAGLSAYEYDKELKGHSMTYDEWFATLKGDEGPRGRDGVPGKGLEILGRFDTEDQLPTDAAEQDTYMVGTHLFMFISGTWTDLGEIKGDKGDVGPRGLRGEKGDKGDSAYQIAVDAGFEGSQAEWLASLKGVDGKDAYEIALEEGFEGSREAWLESLKGEPGKDGVDGVDGKDGEDGRGVNIKGSFTSADQLPGSAAENDAYLVNGDLYVWIGDGFENVGNIQGPRGYSAFELAQQEDPSIPDLPTWLASLKGEKGDTGEKGDKGDKGDTGNSLVVKGTLESTDALADIVDPEVGDTYVIGKHFHIYNGTAFVDAGDFSGPTGMSAFEIAKSLNPDLTNEAEWMLTLKGEKGDQGEQGPQGNSIIHRGSLEALEDLDTINDQEIGHVFTIGTNMYQWDGEEWVNMGDFQGPEGPQGPVGPGLNVLGKLTSTDELPASGNVGEGYVIGLNFWVWTGSEYEDMGPFQGPRGERGPQGVQGLRGPEGPKGEKGDKGDFGSKWIVFPRDPNPVDGATPTEGSPNDYFLNSRTLEFFMKTDAVTWSSMGYLGGGNVYDATADGKRKVRLDGQWVDLDVLEAPEDDGYYTRQNGEWVRLDRYDLAVGPATEVLDLAVQQVFKIDASEERTLTFANAPGAGRAMTVVLKIVGSANITWPAGITWNAETAPALGDSFTTVVLLWDGDEWTGSEGAKA